MASFNEVLGRAQEIWKQIGLNQKITIGAMVISLIVALFFFGDWAAKPDYSLLYSRLNSEDAGKIVEALKEEEIPYKLKDGGSTVLVASQHVYDMRLKMAKKGVPSGGGVGFEIFDKTNIGMTDFVQKLNYIRALEGELTRTIRQMEGVQAVRVHLVVPEEKLFAESQEKPSASVVLQLTNPGMMDLGQIAGIKNLIAGAVEGLGPNNVTIVDSQGNILSKAFSGQDASAELSSVQLGQKKNVEKYLTEKVQTLLEGVLGKNSAMVRVDVWLDFDREERTEEIYDPEKTVVITETITSEKSKGFSGTAKGVPGVASNVGPPEETESTGEKKESSKSKEIVKNTYEVDKITKHIVETVGDVKKLSTAVFIKKKLDVGDDGKKKLVPRSEEELKSYEEIVRNAVGFDAKRGDTVVVREMEFDTSLVEEMSVSMEKAAKKRMVQTIIQNVIKGIIILAFPVLFLVMFNMVKKPKSAAELDREREEKRKISPRAGGKAGEAEAVPEEDIEVRMKRMAEQSPEELAEMITSWLSKEE